MSLRESLGFDLKSSPLSFPLLKVSVGDGMGLSLEGATRLVGEGESSSGGGRLRANSGLFGSELDLWRTTGHFDPFGGEVPLNILDMSFTLEGLQIGRAHV